jgi:hypothetical protein
MTPEAGVLQSAPRCDRGCCHNPTLHQSFIEPVAWICDQAPPFTGQAHIAGYPLVRELQRQHARTAVVCRVHTCSRIGRALRRLWQGPVCQKHLVARRRRRRLPLCCRSASTSRAAATAPTGSAPGHTVIEMMALLLPRKGVADDSKLATVLLANQSLNSSSAWA